MPTINDVAAHAKVSASTVSHVINGTRFVDPETEERVRSAIHALNYRPNSLARSLRRRGTSTIGLIVPDNSNPFFADVARVIEDAGFAEGYSVILGNSDLSEEKQAIYIDVLLSKQVDGLILISSGNRSDPVQHILEAGVPVVVVDREVGDLPVDQVLVDNEQGGYLAGQYLTQLGHQRIGCIAGPSDITPSARRMNGFRRALQEHGIDLIPEAIVRGEGRYTDGAAAMRELIERNLDITAVFAYNDMMAIGALSSIRRASLQVPDDISIIGFDNIVEASAIVPALTTVAQPVAEIGRVTVQLLLDQIRQPKTTRTPVVLPTTLIERESCRAVDVLHM